ncbi:MAG: hypothetical protein JWR09_1788 [Mucilaginibacter sp.]|nr:hypothetical protein [Mucilaginibacter sp.]
MRTLKLITRFYNGIFWANLFITLCCVGIMGIYRDRAYKIIGMLFWFKVITIAVIFYAAIHYQKKEMYYYQNLGVSKLKLGITTSVFDFLLWLVLILIAYR